MDDEGLSAKILGVFAFCFAVFYYLIFSIKNTIGIDGFFHIKYASLILTEGIMRPFYWWAFASYADTHFLYHILLIPFTFFGLDLGVKISAVFFGALAFTTVYWFLKKNNVEFPLFWVLLLFAFGSQALFRFAQPRAFTLAVILFVLGFYFMLNNMYKYLGILSFVFVWSYTAFLIFFGLTIIYFAYKWFVLNEKDYSLLKYSIGGTVLGLLINPFFPENIKTIYVQVVKVLLFRSDILLKSADAQPYQSLYEIFHYFWFVSIIFVVSLFLYYKRKEFTNKVLSFMAIASLISFFLVLRGVRFVKYWVPFTIIFAAMIFTPLLKKWYNTVLEVTENTKITLNKTKIMALLLIILIPFLYLGLAKVQHEMKRADDLTKPDKNLPCARWLEKNTPQGSLVFNYWHEFPQLFFYNSHNKYFVGLDPNYMYNDNPDLYYKYENISLIKTNQTNVWLKNDFKADYIILGTLTNKFVPYYDLFKDFKKVFSTDYCTVYQIIK